MQFYLILALIFSLLVALFAIQNTTVALISFLTWDFSIPLVLLILGSAVAGALVLYFFSLFKQVGSWIRIRQLNNQIEGLEKQMKNLEGCLQKLQTDKEKAEQEKTTQESAAQEKATQEKATQEKAAQEKAAQG